MIFIFDIYSRRIILKSWEITQLWASRFVCMQVRPAACNYSHLLSLLPSTSVQYRCCRESLHTSGLPVTAFILTDMKRGTLYIKNAVHYLLSEKWRYLSLILTNICRGLQNSYNHKHSKFYAIHFSLPPLGPTVQFFKINKLSFSITFRVIRFYPPLGILEKVRYKSAYIHVITELHVHSVCAQNI